MQRVCNLKCVEKKTAVKKVFEYLSVTYKVCSFAKKK